MSLVDCPECKRKISDRARFCPHCGLPFETIKYGIVSVKNCTKNVICYELSNGLGYFILPNCVETIKIRENEVIKFTYSRTLNRNFTIDYSTEYEATKYENTKIGVFQNQNGLTICKDVYF